MDKKDLLSQQLDPVSLDALNTPSKAQEQLQETSQEAHNSNKKDSTQALHGEDLPISDVYRTTNKQ
ncbi:MULTISPECIES: hypothetical protein [Bacillus]|jgi:hypothetical protein|uniref:Group-specific protein n=3 Tax=Bacillaceae TaxID=186817 RepID=A0A0B5SCC9_BACMY|nr:MULTISPECIES: hypothetical protein [Bacillus]MBJ7997294.1 hypothetical protein [Bacillus cereus]AJH19099.1 hypothetical protein BG05_3468 [Bacillus mycoides]EEK70011.1 hypothetical protein bcere0007_55840 [Bacillus mycoides]EEL99281.1 hypothetical protein bmyco0001_22530 [Bacillus mycoides DSM 2048]EJP98187.1 hypothetical protein IC3_00800 [Bacillus cereus VD142]